MSRFLVFSFLVTAIGNGTGAGAGIGIGALAGLWPWCTQTPQMGSQRNRQRASQNTSQDTGQRLVTLRWKIFNPRLPVWLNAGVLVSRPTFAVVWDSAGTAMPCLAWCRTEFWNEWVIYARLNENEWDEPAWMTLFNYIYLYLSYYQYLY